MWYVKNEILNVEFILRFTIRYNITTLFFITYHTTSFNVMLKCDLL